MVLDHGQLSKTAAIWETREQEEHSLPFSKTVLKIWGTVFPTREEIIIHLQEVAVETKKMEEETYRQASQMKQIKVKMPGQWLQLKEDVRVTKS